MAGFLSKVLYFVKADLHQCQEYDIKILKGSKSTLTNNANPKNKYLSCFSMSNLCECFRTCWKGHRDSTYKLRKP